MRHVIRLLFPLLLPVLALAEAELSPSPPAIYTFVGGRLRPDSVRVIDHRPLRPARDMAVDGLGDLLLLSREGELLRLARTDSLPFRHFGGDLSAGSWPEAVDSDGVDWLLLDGQGRGIRRIGRRGEALESVQTPDLGPFWRDLAADRSGRIWLAEGSGGRFAMLSRSGQLLQDWDLERWLPGFTPPVIAWCPDEHGGLYIAEGWPVRLHHVNAAGNPLGLWQLDLPDASLAFAIDEQERLTVAIDPGRGELLLAARGRLGELFCKTEDELWILARDGKGP